jgi:general secretion pathway protein G
MMRNDLQNPAHAARHQGRWRASSLGSRRSIGWGACSAAGLTLIELIVAVALLSILCGMAVPLARNVSRREKERTLRANLRAIREAIDTYEQGSTSGMFFKAPSAGYPPNLQALVDPIELRNGHKLRLLREIPIDPMTGNRDWGVHSMEDDPDSDNWDGNQIWNVYSKAEGTALDGTKYRDW